MYQVRDLMTPLDTSQRLNFWFSFGLTYNEIVSCHNLKASCTSKQKYPEKKDRALKEKNKSLVIFVSNFSLK